MMSFVRTFHAEGDDSHQDHRHCFLRSNNNRHISFPFNCKINDNFCNFNIGNQNSFITHTLLPAREIREQEFNLNYVKHGNDMPSLKKRKTSALAWENCHGHQQQSTHEAASITCDDSIPSSRPNTNAYTSTSGKRDRSKFEEDDVTFMSRDEIERCSPSRKDGIDAFHETHLRYSYCAFIQNLGLHLDLPLTTIGTAIVLCHRFFFRQSHASHDRFLIATAALFLAAKSEETACPLNNVLRASSEILHKQDFTFLSYLLPIGWFEQYKERVVEAEEMILTTLNFELNVQHPYAPLTSVLDKLGLSHTVLVNLALNLVSVGVYTRIACSPLCHKSYLVA